VETISDVIADQTGSGGTGGNRGTGGVTINGAGTLVLDARNTFTGGVTLDSGVLEIGAGGSAGSGKIAFEGSQATPPTTATLVIDGATMPTNQIADFAPGDAIDLANVAHDPNGTAHLDPSNDILTVTENGASYELQFDSSVSGRTFELAADSGSGTDITICFMAGTLVRTPDGEVAVETLLRGDLVLTAEGLVKPVCWLGRQTISTRFADPLRVLPIRVKAGALGENIPCRDLLLSPDHALLVEDALIHAGAPINGTSITRENAVPERFTYYHVELDDHSLILAENAPAETFVDNVERLAFDNWAEHEALYPDGKPIEELPYPRAKGRRQVPLRIRAWLDERAKMIGANAMASVA
jgi:autotransporter-associated beta strand protein